MAGHKIHNLSVYRGDDYQWKFRLWKDAKKTEPTDLTGVTVRAEIRERSQGRNIVPLACTTELPNVIIMKLLATDSVNISQPGSAWDLRLTYANGNRRTILSGTVKVMSDVTDSTPSIEPSTNKVA